MNCRSYFGCNKNGEWSKLDTAVENMKFSRATPSPASLVCRHKFRFDMNFNFFEKIHFRYLTCSQCITNYGLPAGQLRHHRDPLQNLGKQFICLPLLRLIIFRDYASKQF